MIRLRICILGKNISSSMLFSVYHIRLQYTDASYFCDVNLDHLGKVLSTKFLHCKVAVTSSVINILGRYFESTCFSSYFCSPI